MFQIWNIKLKLLEENLGENLYDPRLDKEFLNIILKQWAIKENINS